MEYVQPTPVAALARAVGHAMVGGTAMDRAVDVLGRAQAERAKRCPHRDRGTYDQVLAYGVRGMKIGEHHLLTVLWPLVAACAAPSAANLSSGRALFVFKFLLREQRTSIERQGESIGTRESRRKWHRCDKKNRFALAKTQEFNFDLKEEKASPMNDLCAD